VSKLFEDGESCGCLFPDCSLKWIFPEENRQEGKGMQKDLKLRIISEGMSHGVSATCRKYSISRTIYYRWLKRYKAVGIDGLDVVRRNFTPSNKTSPEIEKALLDLIRVYPSYGPKALGYLLEELGYKISSSAVFNILKRHKLTNKYIRMKYARISDNSNRDRLPPVSQLKSGEGWIFWTTDCGSLGSFHNIYSYTLLDLRSRIACSRLYTDISLGNTEDLLEAVALSVASTLNLNSSHLCFLQEDKIVQRFRKSYKSRLADLLTAQGKDISLELIDGHRDIQAINEIKEDYTSKLMSHILPLFYNNMSFPEIKKSLQHFIRDYNLNSDIQYDDRVCSPVEYHNKLTNTKLILPLWAYIDRDY